MLVKRPSLELNWLPKPKQASLPDLCIVDTYDYSGCYYSPEHNDVVLDNRNISLENGLLIIKSTTLPSTIAHEFRHHLQWLTGLYFDGIDWSFNKPYKDAIVEYYTNSVTEMDALLYECKNYPEDENMQCFEWVMNHKKGDK